ncbi:Fic/DOC family protein [Pseudomonas sp. NPDC089996]|uniref:Fic/DOC family protein n=1 Tax=Pseudomonas sp. NPDC089996 TaxID=3364474 RepID=UPI003807521C
MQSGVRAASLQPGLSQANSLQPFLEYLQLGRKTAYFCDQQRGSTRFCSPEFIEPESRKEFLKMAEARWFEDYPREQLIIAVAEAYGTLNVAHPFREGNGRTQRILFEWVIVNAGFSITWDSVESEEWITANIYSYLGDDEYLVNIFGRCIGQPIQEDDMSSL